LATSFATHPNQPGQDIQVDMLATFDGDSENTPRQFSIFFFSAAIWTISLLTPFRLTRVTKSSALNGYW
jgi:hypothetical protein